MSVGMKAGVEEARFSLTLMTHERLQHLVQRRFSPAWSCRGSA